MINTKRPNTNDYTQVGFIEAKDNQGNYQNIDHIYDSEGNIVFQQGYLNEYDGADDFSIPAIGKPLIDYIIYGNAFQDGIPTSGNPIMPQGTGERTGNLAPYLTEWVDGYINSSGTISTAGSDTKEKSSDYIELHDEQIITFSYPNGFPHTTATNAWRVIAFYKSDKTFLTRIGGAGDITALTASVPENAKYARLSMRNYGWTGNTMLNSGSTALSYEPYGYKIPISSAGQTNNIYLGEVETTRRIRKLVFTGEENWGKDANKDNIDDYFYTDIIFEMSPSITPISSHFVSGKRDVVDSVWATGTTANPRVVLEISKSYTGITSADDKNARLAKFKAYLATQYAAGTPVTVWYVLATEETAVVNEPLMRIGNYADTLSMEQAGVQIPTLKRPNTTVIDITTSLPPSEVYAKYRGSKTQKYDLFLAANGDSFEAKNGQSLYIGDDT